MKKNKIAAIRMEDLADTLTKQLEAMRPDFLVVVMVYSSHEDPGALSLVIPISTDMDGFKPIASNYIAVVEQLTAKAEVIFREPLKMLNSDLVDAKWALRRMPVLIEEINTRVDELIAARNTKH